MNNCIIGIGSNIQPEKNISLVIEILKQENNVHAVSEFVKTKPIGITNQPDFTNGAVKLETNLRIDEFNEYLKKLENRIGRNRKTPKFGPRTIDLDIVIWNDQVVDEDYYSRDFLRKAVAELGFVTK